MRRLPLELIERLRALRPKPEAPQDHVGFVATAAGLYFLVAAAIEVWRFLAADVIGPVWRLLRPWLLALTVMLATSVIALAAETACGGGVAGAGPAGGTCICSSPLNQPSAGSYTQGPTDFWRPTNADGLECSQDGTGRPVVRTSTIVGTTDATALAALPAGHSVSTVMRPQDNDHQGTFYTGHGEIVSASFVRLAARFYRYFSPAFEFSGEGSGGCFNSKFIQSDVWNSDFDHDGNTHFINTGLDPARFSPNTDCCTSGTNAMDYAASRGKWYRFEAVIVNREGPQYDAIIYGKNITDGLAEFEIMRLRTNPQSAGASPDNLTPINPSLSSMLLSNGHRAATTSCLGFSALSYYMMVGWTTNAGQRIGAAEEVEGAGTPPAAFGMTSPWIRFIGLVGVLVALLAAKVRMTA
jgi:hypothetical protein